MTEWGVVGVIVVLLGLIVTIVTPIIKLNANVTRMTVILERLDHDQKSDTQKNTESHRRIWEKLEDHGERISQLEHRKECSV